MIGSGGAATTSFHMTRKNSNAKITDLANTEDTVNQREILNLLHTLLSINVSGDESQLTQEELDCRAVLTDKHVQLQLGKFGSFFMTKFVNVQSSVAMQVSHF